MKRVLKRLSWTGWLLAALMLLQSATAGLARTGETNPLDGLLMQHSSGTFYLYHAGTKFALQVADMGDVVIDAIPTGSSAQWELLLREGPAFRPALPNRNPEPFPGYS